MTRISKALIITLLTAIAWDNLGRAQGENALTVPSRIIPVPDTLSPAMQKILAQPRVSWPKPPQTAAEWKAEAARLSANSQSTDESLEEVNRKMGISVSQQTLGGVHCYRVTPASIRPDNRHRLMISLHHGGFFRVPGEGSAEEAVMMAGVAGYPVIVIDYRGLPENPYPAGMDDAIAVWKAAIKLAKPGNIAVFGSSAGGGMVLSLVQRARREGLPLPGVIMAGTPWTDLSKTGDSWYTNDDVDAMLGGYDGFWAAVAKRYAGGRDLKDPLISPVYGDFKGFPPTYLISGTRDLYLSNTVRVQHKLLEAGVPVQLEVLEGQFHGAYLIGLFEGIPETTQLYTHIAQFFDVHLGR